jgi:hypothetical protein
MPNDWRKQQAEHIASDPRNARIDRIMEVVLPIMLLVAIILGVLFG